MRQPQRRRVEPAVRSRRGPARAWILPMREEPRLEHAALLVDEQVAWELADSSVAV
jgi:hypothetical protein